MNKYLYSSNWVNRLESKRHWVLYWNQQRLMANNIHKNEKIAEIGIGSKFTYNYLKSRGYNITSIDIDKNKEPDLLVNIVSCHEKILKFDDILAYNIFEHIPYREFIEVINKFNKAGIKKIFMCLPVNRKIIFEFYLKLGKYFEKKLSLSLKKNKITEKHHHWEIDYKNFTVDKVIHDISVAGYKCRDRFVDGNQVYFYFNLNN